MQLSAVFSVLESCSRTVLGLAGRSVCSVVDLLLTNEFADSQLVTFC